MIKKTGLPDKLNRNTSRTLLFDVASDFHSVFFFAHPIDPKDSLYFIFFEDKLIFSSTIFRNSRTKDTFVKFQAFSRTKVKFKDFSRSVPTLSTVSEILGLL